MNINNNNIITYSINIITTKHPLYTTVLQGGGLQSLFGEDIGIQVYLRRSLFGAIAGISLDALSSGKRQEKVV